MNKELLEKLCLTYGPTGQEKLVRDLIIDEIKDYVDDYEIDNLGNLIAHKKGEGEKLMLAGHMDSIGFMATYIDDNGYVYITPVGGLSPDHTFLSRFEFKNGTTGVLAREKQESSKDFKLSKMYIDIGARNKEEAEKLVNIGDVGVFKGEFISDDMKVISPYLDDRVGCFIMIEALKKIEKPAFDLYFVFTVQEEIGLKGATTAAYQVNPDYGLAFDVTASMDAPGEKRIPNKMHNGACIKLKDSSVLSHSEMVDKLIEVAEDNEIKYQLEILEFGGTDAGAMATSRDGVKAGGISIATRYIHSPSEMASWSDIEEAIKLTHKFCETKF